MLDPIFFRGISKHGKNRIEQNGMIWSVINEGQGKDLAFTNEDGLWWLLKSELTGWHRWFKVSGDKHFERVC